MEPGQTITASADLWETWANLGVGEGGKGKWSKYEMKRKGKWKKTAEGLERAIEIMGVEREVSPCKLIVANIIFPA